MHTRDFQPGESVPGTVYQVIRLLGAGGMGTVYDVEDTTIGKRYVLKTLQPQLGAREDLARRMQNEARTLARLHHPNIVEVITAGVTADELKLPYYVMERLNGQSLRVILSKKGQIDLPHVFHIGIDLLDALDHAHDKGVVHRDVKPDNIFLHRTPAGVTVTKLLDFGIVSMLDGGGETASGRFLGTLRYAAPEQLRGEKPTVKTDLYAAGLVLYESIAGRGPFDDEGEPQQVGAAHLHKAPPPLSRFASVPAELERLLMASLAKSAEQRPRDAFSFAASLRNMSRVYRGASGSSEQTEQGATAPAMLGPASARTPAIESPSVAGRYRIVPRPAPKGPEAVHTTLHGLAPSATAVSHEAPTLRPGESTSVRPESPTRSADTDHALSSQMATEVVPELGALGGGRPPAAGDPSTALTPPDPAQPPLGWPRPPERSRSDDPHVRSLPAGPFRSGAPWRVAAVAGVAVAAVGVYSVFAVARPSRLEARASITARTASPLQPAPETSASCESEGTPPAALSEIEPPEPAAENAVLSPPPTANGLSANEESVPRALEGAAAASPNVPKSPAPSRSASKASTKSALPAKSGLAADRPGPGF
ncbi:MAG: protein kinase [Polyangiaceae bacterium]|nr:protein kinase [Polyangiaceae bacterium]